MKELRDLKDLTIHDVQPIKEPGLADLASPDQLRRARARTDLSNPAAASII